MRPTDTPQIVSELRTAALGYALRGWHVLPLRPGSKRPAIPTHPADRCDRTDPDCAHGHTGWEARASTDPAQIADWWHHTPFGIGIATGPSGLVVVDLDIAKNEGEWSGAVAFVDLAAVHGHRIPTTFTVATPSGGWHLYFTAPPAGPALGNTAGRLGPNIDTRAAGGYVVAPPTNLSRVGRYSLPRAADPILLPDWLHQQLATPPQRPRKTPTEQAPADGRPTPSASRLGRYVATGIAAETRRVTTAQPGARNHTLFTAAVALGQLVGAGALDEATAIAALDAAAAGHIAAGAFDTIQARATITSGLRRGVTEPRRLPAALTLSGRPVAS